MACRLIRLVQTLKPEQMIHVDERKLTEAQVRARDMDDILVTEDEASRRQQAQSADPARADGPAEEDDGS